MKRLAIVVTHPIQYYAPVFKLMTERKLVAIKVFYTWGTNQMSRYDPGFKREIDWDIPLLEGYDYTFVRNTSRSHGSSHFKGIINPTLVQEVVEWEPDAVLVYGWNYHSHLTLLRKLKGRIPIWFRGDSHLLDKQPIWKSLLRFIILRWVYRNVDFAFYVGTENKKYYLRHGLKENQLCFAPHAIDNKRFFDSDNLYAKQALLWRAQMGIHPEDFVVLFAGKFEAKKQPDFLIEAIQFYNNTNAKPIKLLMVGNGNLEPVLKQKAQGDQHILFLDFQNQSVMPLVYRLGNVFCLPSSGPGETWGLAVNEALASGIPIIVSNKVGCARDLVIPGKTGFIFKFNEIKSLLDAISKSKELVKTINCKNDINARISLWSFDIQCQSFENQLKKI